MVKETKKRLDLVPNQRPPVIEPAPVIADAPAVVDVPQPRAAPSPLVEPQPVPAVPRTMGVRRTVWVGLAAGVVIAVAAGGAVYATEERAQEAEADALAAGSRVDEHVLAVSRDAVAERSTDAVVAQAAYLDSRADATTTAQAAVDHATSTLAAVPNAGDAPRAALAGASGAVGAALAAPDVSLRSLRSLVAGVAAPEKAAVDAQGAWQVAENARIAAEQGAAAAAAEAARAARSTATRTPARSTARSTVPRASSGTTSSGTTTAPVPSSGSGVPSGGKVCSGSGGSGAGESSVSAIGSAINAYRSSLGLPQLSISRSGSLVSHAINMANSGGIWHSGGDNIVACVSSGSASAMVSAWSNSPGHDAQMRRTDVSSMGVGGASLNGWLFGAVKFS
ncbi:CAP domain-containing protein [Cellulomonas sp. Leaf395]|uniref:CAP domain-containing protein n=1 Tax=Cellulomonas sp. Leaf395 TaxID=1736362 RepID=UPI0006FAB8A9|nr:CAP domain-containing protein [Cellulomonas sp. Leaf395]KQT02248.1 hypothetical protein ASG23_02585 [Cellulomonas sp. Leaf395]